MRGDNRSINIQYKDGTVSRLKRFQAEPLVDSGKAKYVSNTVWRKLRPKPEPSGSKEEKNAEKRQQQTRQQRRKQKRREKNDAHQAD